MKVVGIAGQYSQGKDEVADYLIKRLNSIVLDEQYKKVPLASNVKRIYCEIFGVDLAFVEKWKREKDSPPGFSMNVRQSLQFIGDGFRQIKGDIWIDLLFKNRKKSFIISDVRYINELKKIKEIGGINVLLWRPGFENNDSNASESQIKSIVDWFKSIDKEGFVIEEIKKMYSEKFKDIPENALYIDLFIKNNGTLEDLYNKIEHIILPYMMNSPDKILKVERFICTSLNPWDGKTVPVAHPDAKEVGEQMDGYPGGDFQMYHCPHCGKTFEIELPQ